MTPKKIFFLNFPEGISCVQLSQDGQTGMQTHAITILHTHRPWEPGTGSRFLQTLWRNKTSRPPSSEVQPPSSALQSQESVSQESAVGRCPPSPQRAAATAPTPGPPWLGSAQLPSPAGRPAPRSAARSWLHPPARPRHPPPPGSLLPPLAPSRPARPALTSGAPSGIFMAGIL